MRKSLRARVGVKALIFRGSRVLLLRRSSGSPWYPNLWELPGGGVEEGETLEEALAREMREETGMSLRIGLPYHATLAKWPSGHGRTVPSLVVTLYCTTRYERPPHLDSEEHSEFAWVRRRDLPDYRMTEVCSDAVRLAFARRRALATA